MEYVADDVCRQSIEIYGRRHIYVFKERRRLAGVSLKVLFLGTGRLGIHFGCAGPLSHGKLTSYVSGQRRANHARKRVTRAGLSQRGIPSHVKPRFPGYSGQHCSPSLQPQGGASLAGETPRYFPPVSLDVAGRIPGQQRCFSGMKSKDAERSRMAVALEFVVVTL